MLVRRWIAKLFPLAWIIALVVDASMARAQDGGRRLFEWAGDVDREVRITMRGDNVWARFVGDNEDGRGRSFVQSDLPSSPGYVRVELERGRGDVDVLQQPSRFNGYTAVLRISDPRGGSDRYRIAAYWQPTYAYGNGNDNGRGWGRGGVRRGDGDDDDDNGRRGGNTGGVWGHGQSGSDYTAGSMHWSGDVDDAVELRIRGQRVDLVNLSGAGMRSVRYGFNGQGLPTRPTWLSVTTRDGRGDVFVVQQPSADNGYTGVIRIRDPQGGFGHYDFDVSWR